MALVLSACGGDATFGGGGDGGGNPGGGAVIPDDGAGPLLEARIGVLTGGNFTEGALAIGTPSLSAGGQTAVRLDVVDAQGLRLSNVPLTASFRSECANAGLSRFEPATLASDSGRFDVTYVAQGCNGADEITAVVQLGGVIATASGVVDVAAAELGSIEFVFAESTVIGLTGSPIPNQAELRFRVRDTTGSPVPNQHVNFTLDVSTGGIGVTPASAVSDAGGVVRTVVRGGTVPTAARVTATLSATQIATQSEQLAISTGIPDQNSMSLGFDRLAVDGTCDGERINVTLRMADRFNNPVPEGTAANFRTEGGAIQAQCFTGNPLLDPAEEAGACTVAMNVRNPRPANGRATVLATALGEETFIDRNGNGYFDSGDGAVNDLPEAFLDENENGLRDPDEPFVDTNSDQQYSLANNAFDGFVCQSPGIGCSTRLFHVRDSGEVVFSLARAGVVIGCVGAAGGQCPFTPGEVGPGQALDLVFDVSDVNGQVPPTGTTYTLEASAGNILEPATVGPFNSNANGPQRIGFRFQAPEEAPESPVNVTLTLRVDLPESACSEGAARSAFVANFVLPAAIVEAAP